MQGHIRKRIHTTAEGRQSINWYVVVDHGRGADGQRRQKWHGAFRTRKEAEAARATLVHELNSGTYVEPTSITLEIWVRRHCCPRCEARSSRQHSTPTAGTLNSMFFPTSDHVS